MKLRTKLIIAFLTIILLPILTIYLSMSAWMRSQITQDRESFPIRLKGFFSTNAITLINGLTEDAFNKVKDELLEHPEKCERKEELEALNGELRQVYSFMILRREGGESYIGEENLSEAFFEKLPDFEGEDAVHVLTYMEDERVENNYLVKQQDFYDPSGKEVSLFILTPLNQTLPQIRGVIVQMVILVIIFVSSLSLLLAIWIYRAILRPLNKLRQATQEIKKGNLDFELDIEEQDEIGQICQDFEEMRQRLKESAEEKVQVDTENKILISNISHDLRTPITAIKGYCEGIMDGVASSPEKMEKYIRTIYNKANDMDRLIDELTFYSKIDTNKVPYAFVKLDIGRYFDDCVEELSLELEAKSTTLSYRNTVPGGTIVIADTEQLKRVVGNIVSNSIKYMDKPHGQLSIRLCDSGDFVQIDLEDNGKGISQKDLPYIFDRFYRTDSSRNSAKGGSGIGLAIVKKIVEDHGGQIWATSQEGEGTTMHIVLRKYQEVLHE